MQIALICTTALSLIASAVFFLIWRVDAKKHSLKETEKAIAAFKRDFEGIISERLEITEQKAIEITERFNAVSSEIEFFNAKMREAQTLLMKLDNTNALIGETVEKSISRDEAIVAMNREIEDLKGAVFSKDSGLSAVVEQLADGIEETLRKLNASISDQAEIKKEFDDFERVIVSIIDRIKTLEKRG